MSGGSVQSYIKNFLGFAGLACIVLLFQNCGDDLSKVSDSDSILLSSNCLSETVDCGAKPEYLQVTVDIADNLILPAATDDMLISGRCNVGNYDSHEFRWEIIDDNADVKKSGKSIGSCIRGRYEFLADVSSPLTVGVNYTFRIKIAGGDGSGTYHENVGSLGSAQKDFSKQ